MVNSSININLSRVRTLKNIKIKLPNSSPSQQLPITLKNNNGDVPTIEQLRNVTNATKTGNETLVFNANTNKWEERSLSFGDLTGDGGVIDGGSFN